MSAIESATLQRYLEQFTGTFTPKLAEHFASLPPIPEIQTRVEELAEKMQRRPSSGKSHEGN